MDNSLTVTFRTDASLEIGTGHVMRCLTLALELSKKGASISFLCREHDGNLIDLIRSHGFLVHVLPLLSQGDYRERSQLEPSHASWLGCDWGVDVEHCQTVLNDPVDWIIIDHYALDYRWEKAMRGQCTKMMCIDDLADRVHECDVLLDQNFGRNKEDYSKLVLSQTKLLIGPQYALLRPEFKQWRTSSLTRRTVPSLNHILISMGGVDQRNMTSNVLHSVEQFVRRDLERITVILGPQAPWIEAVKELGASMTVTTSVLSNVKNMAELMTASDLIIGAGGATTWERCSLGVPSIVIPIAKNQLEMSFQLQKLGAIHVLSTRELLAGGLEEVVKALSREKLISLSKVCSSLCDGLGVKSVLQHIV